MRLKKTSSPIKQYDSPEVINVPAGQNGQYIDHTFNHNLNVIPDAIFLYTKHSGNYRVMMNTKNFLAELGPIVLGYYYYQESTTDVIVRGYWPEIAKMYTDSRLTIKAISFGGKHY